MDKKNQSVFTEHSVQVMDSNNISVSYVLPEIVLWPAGETSAQEREGLMYASGFREGSIVLAQNVMDNTSESSLSASELEALPLDASGLTKDVNAGVGNVQGLENETQRNDSDGAQINDGEALQVRESSSYSSNNMTSFGEASPLPLEALGLSEHFQNLNGFETSQTIIEGRQGTFNSGGAPLSPFISEVTEGIAASAPDPVFFSTPFLVNYSFGNDGINSQARATLTIPNMLSFITNTFSGPVNFLSLEGLTPVHLTSTTSPLGASIQYVNFGFQPLTYFYQRSIPDLNSDGYLNPGELPVNPVEPLEYFVQNSQGTIITGNINFNYTPLVGSADISSVYNVPFSQFERVFNLSELLDGTLNASGFSAYDVEGQTFSISALKLVRTPGGSAEMVDINEFMLGSAFYAYDTGSEIGDGLSTVVYTGGGNVLFMQNSPGGVLTNVAIEYQVSDPFGSSQQMANFVP